MYKLRQSCALSPSLHQPQTPHLEEDLKEVLRSEAGIELIIEDDVKPEKQKRKQGVNWFCFQYLFLGCPVQLRGVFLAVFILLFMPKSFSVCGCCLLVSESACMPEACLKYCRLWPGLCRTQGCARRCCLPNMQGET